MKLAYPYGQGLYLNLTNRCPTACRFCVKRAWKWRYRGWNLKLGPSEPGIAELWKAVLAHADLSPFRELVYCGYGESTYRLPALLEISRRARARFPRAHLRLNTIGLGSSIWGRSIAGELRPALDEVSVSLNTADPAQWLTLHAPLPPFRKRGFESVLEFIRECLHAGLDTTVTAVDLPEVDLESVRALALRLGARFRSRPPL